jgi:hypothetical protein
MGEVIAHLAMSPDSFRHRVRKGADSWESSAWT